jgi:hypothetical protein
MLSHYSKCLFISEKYQYQHQQEAICLMELMFYLGNQVGGVRTLNEHITYVVGSSVPTQEAMLASSCSWGLPRSQGKKPKSLLGPTLMQLIWGPSNKAELDTDYNVKTQGECYLQVSGCQGLPVTLAPAAGETLGTDCHAQPQRGPTMSSP